MTQSPDFPELEYIHAVGDGGTRSETQCVVIHATDNTAPARNEAVYASRRTDNVSAHIYGDENELIQALPLGHIAYGCFSMGNNRSVQFELCGLSNQLSDATLRKAAPYVAKVCQRYGLPIQHVGPEALRNGVKGICGHGDVTLAWHQGDHTDPGPSFPWATFLGYVAESIGQPVPTTPVSNPTPGYEMLAVDGDWGPRTTRRLQQYFGTPQDGVISLGPGQSSLTAAMQRKLNALGCRDESGRSLVVDGDGRSFAPQDGHKTHSIAALQRRMGTGVDGYLTPGDSVCVRAMQSRLNGNTF